MSTWTLLRSRKLISPFVVDIPTTVDDALEIRRAYPHAAFMAGGVDLADRMKNGVPYDRLIRLNAIPELTTITEINGRVRIGAAVSHYRVSTSPLLRQHFPSFAAAVGRIGSPRIRSQGTLGGNLMSGAPQYDVLPMLMALSADLQFVDHTGVRKQQTAQPGIAAGHSNLLTSIDVPYGAPLRNFTFYRSDKPVLALAAATYQTDAETLNVRVVLSSAKNAPVRREVRVSKDDTAASISRQAAVWRESLPNDPDDSTSSAWYRTELAEVRLRRMLMQEVESLR